MWTSHPAFRRMFALATVSVGLVHCVSTHSPSFEAWIVNKAILPQSMSRKGRSGRVELRGQAAKAAKIRRPTIQKGRRHWRAAAGPVKLTVYEQHFQPRLAQDSRSLCAGEALIAVAEPEILQMWPDGYKSRVMKSGPHRRAARIAGCRLSLTPGDAHSAIMEHVTDSGCDVGTHPAVQCRPVQTLLRSKE